MSKRILVNQIQTPDGTILISRHVHDCVFYDDKASGEKYMNDGGNEYLRRSQNQIPAKDITIYEDSPFEEIRKYYCRGGRGKNGDQPLTWVPLYKMSDEWLENCVVYNKDLGFENEISTQLYIKEIKYRKENHISIKD